MCACLELIPSAAVTYAPLTRRASLLGLLSLAACQPVPAPRAGGPRYSYTPPDPGSVPLRLAVHPLHNPHALTQYYQPLVDHLNRHLGGPRVELEASRDYGSYESKFRQRAPALLLPNPWQTLEAMKVGYRVIAMAGDAQDFRGIFIVRRDSRIRSVADLRRKVVSYPSPTALAAAILPQDFLHEHGIDVNRDIDNRYVGSQESAIMNAYLRQSDIAATWPPPWRLFQRKHPGEAAELRVIWETPPLVNNSVMVRDDVPATVTARVRELLLGLHGQAEGKTVLEGMEIARFHPADDASYEPVRRFIEHFEREVRPVERT